MFAERVLANLRGQTADEVLRESVVDMYTIIVDFGKSETVRRKRLWCQIGVSPAPEPSADIVLANAIA